MNISEHGQLYKQEMGRRGYSERSIKTYYSNLCLFLSKATKDHPKNVNEQDIRDYLSQFDEANTQRSHHSAIKLFYDLFNGQNSLQYSSRSINEFLKAIAKKANVCNKRIYAHLIRHCTFTHMLENGVDLTIIQKVAGHSSIKTTQGYTHISNNLISKTFSPLSNISL